MKRKHWICAAVIIAILIITEFIMPVCGDGSCNISSLVSRGYEKCVSYIATQKVKKQLKDHTQRYQQKNEELLNEFLNKLPTVAEAEFQAAENNVVPFVKQSTKFTFSCKLMYRLAKDKFSKTNTATELLAPVITKHFAEPLAAAQIAMQNELQNFMLRVQENDNQYRAGLTELTKSEVFQKSEFAANRALIQRFEQLNSEISKFAVAKVTTAVATGMEIILIRSTFNAIRSMLVRCGSRLAASAGLAGGAAVIDGPLPIGDAIGAVIIVGGTVWTMYDICKVFFTMPNSCGRQCTIWLPIIVLHL